MSRDPEQVTTPEETAVRTYLLICTASLLVILVAEARDETWFLTLLPVLAGALGLVMRTSMASAMLLLTLAGKIFLVHLFRPPWYRSMLRSQGAFWITDLLLAMGVLAYIIAHYRMTGLVRSIFPTDPRRRELVPRADGYGVVSRQLEQKRSKSLVGPLEFVYLFVAVLGAGLLATIIWKILPGRWVPIGLPSWLWAWTGLIVPTWLLALGLLLAWGLFSYWGLRNMSPSEGQVLLQDVLWHETRREQRWLGRWLAWDLRQKKKNLRKKEIKS